MNDLNELTPQALRRVRWVESRRPEQIPPAGDWLVWLIQTGRGWGKTRTGAEWVAEQAVDQPGTRWAVVASDEDRDKVMREANRPQFRDMKPMFFPYSAVEELYSLCQRRNLKGVNDDFLDCFMEPCVEVA